MAPTHGCRRLFQHIPASAANRPESAALRHVCLSSRTSGCSTPKPRPSRGRAKQEIRETTERFIELVGLKNFADVYPHQLSGGMKQRVAIARVLANDAEVVLMDEPFGALDAMTRERLQDELVELWSRTALTVLFVTHSIEEAIFLADRVVVMSPGPGRIDSEFVIDLPRPRDIASNEFNEWRRLLSSKLHSHHGRKAA